MLDNIKAGELNQGNILLKPSASDGYFIAGSWVLSIIFAWALLERFFLMNGITTLHIQ